MRALFPALLASLTSCAGAYHHGALLVDPETGAAWGNARAYPCVDAVVHVESFAEVPPGGQVVGLELGNPCGVSVETDYGALRVRMAREREGVVSELVTATAWDPRHEIRRARLAPRDRVLERIVFFDETTASSAPVVRVCVGLHGVIPSAPPEDEVCFRRRHVRDEEGVDMLASWEVDP